MFRTLLAEKVADRNFPPLIRLQSIPPIYIIYILLELIFLAEPTYTSCQWLRVDSAKVSANPSARGYLAEPRVRLVFAYCQLDFDPAGQPR